VRSEAQAKKETRAPANRSVQIANPPPPIKQTLGSYTLSNRADERAIRD